VYLLFSGGSSLFFTLVVTVNLIYQATVVGLSPLQLVLVGTLLEAVTFAFEVPTGIVADLYSRRLSVIVGFALMGCGFTLEGSIPTFAAVLGSQVLWGIGYTFTSGASDAWVTDEMGEAQMAPVFLRGTQVALVASIVGVILSAALGLIAIQLPIVLGGIGFVVLAMVLLLTMPENAFHRTPAGERTTLGHMMVTFQEGLAMARRRVVVRSLLLVSLVIGLASEAFDRLWIVHMIDEFDFPKVFGTEEPVVWFALISLIGMLLSLSISELVKRVSPQTIEHLHPHRILTALAVVQVGGALAFALAGNLWVAMAMLWLKNIGGTIAYPVSAAWMNRSLETATRATVLSMQGQLNAVGQVMGGPALGWVGNAVSVRAALIGSALVFSPIVWLYGRIDTDTEVAEERPAVSSASSSASSSAPE
jgi:DHA3 family tetracycline resistance protein-like MFS transporter